MPVGACFYRDYKSDNVKKAALQMPLNEEILMWYYITIIMYNLLEILILHKLKTILI
jgi:hypothetical protein